VRRSIRGYCGRMHYINSVLRTHLHVGPRHRDTTSCRHVGPRHRDTSSCQVICRSEQRSVSNVHLLTAVASLPIGCNFNTYESVKRAEDSKSSAWSASSRSSATSSIQSRTRIGCRYTHRPHCAMACLQMLMCQSPLEQVDETTNCSYCVSFDSCISTSAVSST